MWPAAEPLLLPVLVGAFGWLWGSFLNQLVDRTPRRRGLPRPSTAEAPPEVRPTLLRPLRSLCFSCHEPIPWFENLPVFSYLALRGRCRRCGAPIGLRTLLMELATPLAFLALLLLAPGRTGLGAAFPWGYLLLSWGLVAPLLLWERREISWWFLIGGGISTLGVFLSPS